MLDKRPHSTPGCRPSRTQREVFTGTQEPLEANRSATILNVRYKFMVIIPFTVLKISAK